MGVGDKEILIMEPEVERIFNRQFKRCEDELKQVNCPQIFIDCVSKYFRFTKLDIQEIMENGTERNFNN